MSNKTKQEPHKCDCAKDLFETFLRVMDQLRQDKELLEKGFKDGEDDFLVRLTITGLLKIIEPIHEKYPLFLSFYDKDIYQWALKIEKDMEDEYYKSMGMEEIKEDLPKKKNKVS